MTNKINITDIIYHYIQSCKIYFLLNAHKTLTMTDHLLTLKQISTDLKEEKSERVYSLIIMELSHKSILKKEQLEIPTILEN